MKKFVLILWMTILPLFAFKGLFQTVDKKEATLLQTGKKHERCPVCNMSLIRYFKTSHAVQLKNSKVKQYCSIHCLVDDLEHRSLKNKHDQIKKILVVDIKSLKFIDAKKAFYVVDSEKGGTMSYVSKYAFKEKSDALEFMKKNGGSLKSFDEAYEIAKKDFIYPK
jgi:copper chaperone NosL